MKGLKFSCIFAGCGFLLSFLFGLFSHTSILSVLLKALIFGIIFGVLGFCISFIFEKFLYEDSANDFSTDVSQGDSGSVPGSAGSKGQLVDITIQDEELEKSDSENHFMVGDNHQMLHESDIASKVKVEENKDSQPGFVPLKNFETLNGLSGKESVTPDAVTSQPAGSEKAMANAMEEGIDTLPDMNSLVYEDNSSSDSDDDEVANTGFDSATSIHSSSNEVPEIKDAGLMAKAISSVLSDENSL